MNRFTDLLILGILSFVAAAADLKEDQVWAYEARPGEAQSTITVLKVEAYKDLGRVVHIRVDRIQMMNPIKGSVVTNIPHLPFKQEALEKSLTTMVRISLPVPEFKEGYDTWKRAYLAGQVGAFDMSVRDTLNAMVGAKWEEKK